VEKAKSQLKKCKGNDATLANSTQSSQKSFWGTW
jgi:hypothetical protein